MRVIIAEDQGMLRGAMGRLLSMEEDIEVIGEAANGEQALELIRNCSPDIAILDIEMPVLNGLDVAKTLQHEGHPCRIAIVTTFARSGYLQRAIQAGVRGYLLKDAPVTKLADNLRSILKGNKVFSPQLSHTMFEEVNPLTIREQEVLRHLEKGESVSDISQTLFLSPPTIRNYISEIIQKVEAKNRIDAVMIAKRKGWID
jgi:two-component system, NarL family, response regulator DesR